MTGVGGWLGVGVGVGGKGGDEGMRGVCVRAGVRTRTRALALRARPCVCASAMDGRRV